MRRYIFVRIREMMNFRENRIKFLKVFSYVLIYIRISSVEQNFIDKTQKKRGSLTAEPYFRCWFWKCRINNTASFKRADFFSSCSHQRLQSSFCCVNKESFFYNNLTRVWLTCQFLFFSVSLLPIFFSYFSRAIKLEFFFLINSHSVKRKKGCKN